MHISIRYKIAQKIRSWRLKRKYTIKDLADKTGIKYYTLLRYEQGICGIPDEELQVIADALSVSLRDLLPRQKVLKENRCFNKQWMYNFIEKYTKTKGRELRKAICALTQSIRAEEESDVKAARIRMARNMLKAGFATDIIYRATGLSTDEYDNKEEKGSKRRSKRQEMKKWRIIQGYTQEELAKELGVGGPQIHYYEQGSTMFGERLWEIARKLSVNAEDLVLKSTEENCCEDEDTDSEGEKELLSWARESKKISNQESRDELDVWIEFLSQRRQIYKEKIDKVESIKVANNLLILGISIDNISQITSLTAEEIAQLTLPTELKP
ncbi:helix-turn-helix domain-containing protein [Wolbachia endosymbiont of Rhagoletis cerasi]|uniref:WO male-killing family protein Wmk n=1 Tax=Wolbachia endosymbiont of Rhagoletis cerasi TaxID=225363 RepID=UPI001BD233EE|nr:helix-turn-helix transcriptional regulator [Wolbachia endosymbiont of Rhagoletis cerasi]MBS9530009.1 helix-turn-helix domain-containing protein [Wolbachia endosymbiont of Rhagoletis cerasi]